MSENKAENQNVKWFFDCAGFAGLWTIIYTGLSIGAIKITEALANKPLSNDDAFLQSIEAVLAIPVSLYLADKVERGISRLRQRLRPQ